MRRRDFLAAAIVLAADSCAPNLRDSSEDARPAAPQGTSDDGVAAQDDGAVEPDSSTQDISVEEDTSVSQDSSANDQRETTAGRYVFPPAGALWYASHALNDPVADWRKSSGGGFPESGTGRYAVSREHAMSGSQSLKLMIDTTNTSRSHGARAHRWKEPTEYPEFYASAWFYFPSKATTKYFWQCSQIKSKRRPPNNKQTAVTWSTKVDSRSNGNLYIYLREFREWYGQSNVTHKQSLMDIPIGRWFNIEWHVVKSTGNNRNGRVQIWQDGVELWDRTGVRTQHADGMQRWGATLYARGLMPPKMTIYVDDCVISRSRIWRSP